jgi:hypothetical protein
MKLTKSQLKKIIKEELEETIKKVGSKWVVYPEDGGERLGTHSTEKKAQAQLAAIHTEGVGELKEADTSVDKAPALDAVMLVLNKFYGGSSLPVPDRLRELADFYETSSEYGRPSAQTEFPGMEAPHDPKAVPREFLRFMSRRPRSNK